MPEETDCTAERTRQWNEQAKGILKAQLARKKYKVSRLSKKAKCNRIRRKSEHNSD